MPPALGIIESNSLIAIIEAANVMVKTPGVFLTGKETLSSGQIAIKIIGELNALNLAVKNGEEAAKKLGKSVSSYVCAEPDKQLMLILPEISSFYFQKEKLQEPVNILNKKKEKKKELPKVQHKRKKEIEKPKNTEVQKQIDSRIINYENDTIARLRKEALGSSKIFASSSSKESSAEKNDIVIESMNVHQLRRLARDSENFPIQGREISKAKRGDLLNYFKKLN
jgi:microcompartment protein CcmL/EutN